MRTVLFVLLFCWPPDTGVRAQTFTEVSAAAGIRGGAVDPVIMAGGVVWLDYDGDFYPDLLLLNGDLPARLYRNDWDGTFSDVTEAAGLLGVDRTMGAAAADFNGDGHRDLFVSTMAGLPCRLLLNDGSGRFTDASAAAGMTHNSWGASVATGDFDGDGDADVYVTNYLAGADAQEGGQPNFLYRNDGSGRFTEVAASFGLADEGCGLGAVFSDLSGDGRPDLYVANDFGYLVEPNAYFRNEFPAFERDELQNGTAATINAMGVAKSDYDGDGDLDLYVTNIRENPLFRNDGAGDFFTFQSFFAGVDLPERTSWGTAFADFDRDGREDLVVANGEVAETVNEGQPLTYFHNDGDGRFADASVTSGFGAVRVMARGLAVADYDLDGRPDVAVQSVWTTPGGEERTKLLHNESTDDRHYLAVVPPAGALGLTLSRAGQSIYREVDGGSSYLSQNSETIHFGLGDSPAIGSLVVTFTDGPSLTYTGLTADGLIGLRADGSWYRINHRRAVRCATVPGVPTLQREENTETDGRETLTITRTKTAAFTVAEPVAVELLSGTVFRGAPRTQDAMLVDTIAGEGECPTLQPVHLRVLQPTDRTTVYPNPLTGNELTVQVTSGGSRLNAELYAASGALVFRKEQAVDPARLTTTLTLPDLPRGTYFCRLRYAGATTHHKLIRP